MWVSKLLIVGMIFSAMAVLLAGCRQLKETYETVIMPRPVMHRPDYDERKFNMRETQRPTAVQSAVELSEKYARLSEELTSEQRKGEALSRQNAELRGQVTELQVELTQVQKELSESNKFLLDMRIELGQWKHDVLGFRDEMRQAQKVQLEGLARILKVLGAEAISISSISKAYE